MKKKILSIACALTVVLTAFAGAAAVLASSTDALEATRYLLMNGIAVGDAITAGDHRTYIQPQTAQGVTAGTVASLTGVSDAPMLSLNAETQQELGVEFNARTENNGDWNLIKNFDGMQAMMIYVKAPAEAQDLSLLLKAVKEDDAAAEQQLNINVSVPYSTLAKGETAWKPATSTAAVKDGSHFTSALGFGGWLSVPAGFEGWIRVPVGSFNARTGGNVDTQTYCRLYNVTIGFEKVGGAAGAAVVGAPLIVTKDGDFTAVKLDGGAEAKDLFTGEEPKEPSQSTEGSQDPSQSTESSQNPSQSTQGSQSPSQSTGGSQSPSQPPAEVVDTSGIMAAKQAPIMKGISLGGEIPTGGRPCYIELGDDIVRENLSIKAVEPLAGISDYSMLQIDTKSSADDAVTGLSYYSGTRKVRVEFNNLDTPEIWPDISDTDSFLFYVKMPNTPQETGFWFQLHAAAKDEKGQVVMGQENVLHLIKDRPYYTLAKDETQWKEAAAGDYSYVGMEKGGFEGWLRVPFTSFQNEINPAGATGAFNWIYSIAIFCKEFGGEYGAMTIGAPMVVTNSAYTGAAVHLDNSGRIQNLFTGEDMKREDVIRPLSPGDEVLSLPEATTDKVLFRPEETDITATTAKLTWEAMDGAASYRLEVYQNAVARDAMKYVFQKSYTTVETEQLVEGLEPNMRYTVLLRALNAAGKEIAVYEAVPFTSGDEGGVVNPPVIEDTDPTTTPDTEATGAPAQDDTDPASPGTGENSAAPLLTFVLLAAVALSAAAVLRLAAKTRRGNV